MKIFCIFILDERWRNTRLILFMFDQKFQNATYLVTGGAGFIGSHIVDLLIKEGAKKVIVYDNFMRGKRENLADAMKSGRVEIVEADIRDVDALNKAMKGVDYVYHEAALWLLECEDKPRLALDINTIGTFNVCEACVNNGVKKLIAASSSSVYGDGLYFPTDEKHPFNNVLFYGATKVADEQLYRAFHKKYGLPYVAFRYLNVYGPRMDFRSAYIMVIMNFLNKIDKGEAPVIFGDGSATLDLIFVEDVSLANLQALLREDITNDVFNVASGKETTLKELLDIIVKLTGTNIQPVYQPRDEKLVVRRFGCPKKAKEILGFEARTSVEEGIKKVIEWRKEQIVKS